jgi:CheY-like chemotaxis protein
MLILVVEDEGLVAMAIACALQMAGHAVLGPVDNVEEAIALCEQHQPDLALVDLNLRDDGDGIVIARHLKQRFDAPVFLQTAQLTQAREQAKDAWGVIRKPYDTESLPRLVEFVSNVKGGREAQPPPDVEMFWTPEFQQKRFRRV